MKQATIQITFEEEKLRALRVVKPTGRERVYRDLLPSEMVLRLVHLLAAASRGIPAAEPLRYTGRVENLTARLPRLRSGRLLDGIHIVGKDLLLVLIHMEYVKI